MRAWMTWVGLCFVILGVGTVMALDGGSDVAGRSVAASEPASGPATTRAKANAAGPKTNFYGTGGNATKIVYICTHNGVMLDNYDFLRQELKKSTGNLIPVQYFNVVLVSENVEVLGEEEKVHHATSEFKKQIVAKMENSRAAGTIAEGGDVVKEAFEKAFAMKPQLIFFLSSGPLDAKVAEALAELNKEKKVRINTIAFVEKEPKYLEQLQKIAKENGGVYKFVSERDLGR